jgi:dolichol-phosphate mannosyltransferase
MQPAVSLVIPSRHESSTIEHCLRRAFETLVDVSLEIVVVDDSDHDDTFERLQRLRKEVGDQLVLLHRPRGEVAERTLGTAVVTGIRMARGEFVCVMDADGQHPPEIIPTMLAVARHTGADYVGGSRYISGGSPEGLDGWSRKAISRGLALATRLAFLFTPVRAASDPLTGFFLFRRRFVDDVDLRPIGWKISLEVLVRSRISRIAEVPYVFAAREDGDSKATIGQGLLVLRHILSLVLSLLGVRRFLWFGLVGGSGVAVNTGTLMTFAALGFDPLAWPIWVSTEVAILWNYTLNRRITWRERTYGRWWLYNGAAILASLLAISVTTILVLWWPVSLWLGSMIGIVTGMAMNYLIFDRLVFASLAWMSIRWNVSLLKADLTDDMRVVTVASTPSERGR